MEKITKITENAPLKSGIKVTVKNDSETPIEEMNYSSEEDWLADSMTYFLAINGDNNLGYYQVAQR